MNIRCLHPTRVYNKYLKQVITVPCGKCDGCKCNHSREWVTRLEEECASHRYTVFQTLTYHDSALPLLPATEITDEFGDSIEFIKEHDGLIPVLSTRDLQLFKKSLRNNIVKYAYNYNPPKETLFRSFIVGEYGPTTLRPHYHMLLWFDAPAIAEVIKKCIYESWKHKVNYPSITYFFQRNKFSFCSGSASRYVAGYLNCFTHLPSILSEPLTRPKHYQSSRPAIGTIRIQHEQIQNLLTSPLSQISVHKAVTNEQVLVPLWRCLENRFFPRCPRFSQLSHTNRVSLYKFSSLYGKGLSYSDFEQRLSLDWWSKLPLYQLLRNVLGREEQEYEFTSEAKQSCRRLFYLSKKVSLNSSLFHKRLSDYVGEIESYFCRKEYNSLLVQLQFQEQIARCPRLNTSLHYYPFLIDSQFYDNNRKLPTTTYEGYLTQFGLDSNTMYRYSLEHSQLYKDAQALYAKVVTENTKVRQKKDFTVNHPEFAIPYRFNQIVKKFA